MENLKYNLIFLYYQTIYVKIMKNYYFNNFNNLYIIKKEKKFE